MFHQPDLLCEGEEMPDITEEQLAAFKAMEAKTADLEAKAKAADDYKADMFKHKEEAKSHAAELSRLKAAQDEQDKLKMAEQGQYKELLKKSEEEKLRYKQEADTSLDAVTRFVRVRAVETEALKIGIRQEAMNDLRLLGLDKLEVQRSGNEINVLGVEDFITEQKKLRPHWFGEVKKVDFDKGNSGGSGSVEQKLTAEFFKKDPEGYKKMLKAQVGQKP